MTNPITLHAIESAELFTIGELSLEELLEAWFSAQEVAEREWEGVMSLREPHEGSTYIWPISAEADRAWVRYLTATAAATCADLLPFSKMVTTIPDAAASVRPWAIARQLVLAGEEGRARSPADLRALVVSNFEDLYEHEQARQADILRSLIEWTHNH